MNKRLLPLAAASAVVIGTAGLSLIKQSEGVVYKPYRDVVGVQTVCYGHTGNDIIRTKTYSPQECESILIADIRKHTPVITPGNPKNCIGDVPLTANQRDALVSFIFNVGTGNFCSSTMAKKLKAYDYAGAAAQFPRWNRAGNKVYPGLTKRRAAEQALFLSYQRSEPRYAFSGRAQSLLSLVR